MMNTKYLSAFLGLFICFLGKVTLGIKISTITVPQVILSGQSIRLSCYFKLEGDTLYSLTWWKDDLPFFSFVQAKGPKISVFQLPGIFVDKEGSSLHEVHLAHVDHRASGEIRCEVVADYPSFEKDSQAQAMLVVERPTLGPKIIGRTVGYHVGDLLVLNCSSPPSYPPAKLTWYINNNQASTETVIVYPVTDDGHGRESPKSGLQMFLKHRHFRSGVLLLHCRATILDLFGKSAEVSIKDMDFREPSRQGQIDRARATSTVATSGSSFVNISFLLAFLIPLVHQVLL